MFVSDSRFSSLISTGIQASINTKQRLLADCASAIEETGLHLASTLASGGKVLLCGNGGSAADAQHIAAELVIRYRSTVQRRALPAIALTVDASMLTAGANDLGYDAVFARGVEAHGRAGDALVCITTSGNSPSIIRAAEAAQKHGLRVIGLLGCGGGTMLPLCDLAVVVPSVVTARIQESHILVGHLWCEIIEETLFPELFS
ncbi:MAG: D-sedoheptulose 7-phosphate isomerase [Candidatus Kapabacteria bacterium]|jgi:D-sedoheptulose 7-phosphate isomerase|nr:D-sedoheptulose 7-phosphate isomerase [Candidatus Kapabacteria bacterium]